MIAVLLATYNGQNYLRDQLDSLFAQTCQDFIIYVHDDGSTDQTIDILKQYELKYPSKLKLLSDRIKHRGAKDSFMWLLSSVSADYYMFCDQDDIWLPDKIEISLRKVLQMQKKHGNVPIMVHTDLKVVDASLNTIYESYWDMNHFQVDIHRNFNYAAARSNVFTGCTMIINDACKMKAIPISRYASMHDQWIGLIAAKYGYVDNIKKPTVLYRQHGNNVCSAWIDKSSPNCSKLRGYIDYCKSRRPFLDDLKYGSTLKFIWFNRTYGLKKILWKGNKNEA